MDVVEAVVVLTQAERQGSVWKMQGRIESVRAKASAERALVGLRVSMTYEGRLLPKVYLASGLLTQVDIPLKDAEAALDRLAAEEKDVTIEFKPVLLKPMAEPCVRVPLSLLRELRGQEAGAETSRRVLVSTWSDERRTGKPPKA